MDLEICVEISWSYKKQRSSENFKATIAMFWKEMKLISLKVANAMVLQTINFTSLDFKYKTELYTSFEWNEYTFIDFDSNFPHKLNVGDIVKKCPKLLSKP